MNILIIGLGSIARKHINAIMSLNSKANLYALRSNVNAKIEIGITNIVNIEKCNVKFDFAIISNPTYLHYNFIDLLAKNDIVLFIEKPPVSTLINFEFLLNLIKDKKLINYVACNLRFHPCIQYLKKEIQSSNKKINEVNVYCGSYLPDWRPTKNFRESYSVNSGMGGGVHLDLYHELDYTTWIFGIPKKSHCILRNVSSLEIEAIDYANYLLEYNNFSANIVLNYYRRDPKRFLEIIFDDETLTVDLILNSIKGSKSGILYENSNFNIADTYYDQMDYFLKLINYKENSMNSLVDAHEVLKICLLNE
jgi:predicted dehydrogenase